MVTKPIALPPPGFDDLSVEEQLEYLGALWRHVVASGEPKITDEQRQLIRERWARHEANPDRARSWSEVRAELESKYRRTE